MVAYSYQSRFATAIKLGIKTQTIRGPRNRHARPGELIQHYTGLRTKRAAKICSDTVCVRVDPIRLTFSPVLGGAPVLLRAAEIAGFVVPDLDHFARQDGFQDRRDMSAFWVKQHGPMPEFCGFLIIWEAPTDALSLAA
jgi:hypothetical protein